MPLKKKKISELNEASDMKGFFTIGYRVINGVKTSLKFGLEKIQTALRFVVFFFFGFSGAGSSLSSSM